MPFYLHQLLVLAINENLFRLPHTLFYSTPKKQRFPTTPASTWWLNPHPFEKYANRSSNCISFAPGIGVKITNV